jgi:hypothetical protein
VTLSLQSTEVVVQPPLPEARKQLARLVRCLVESAKPFVRWMDGSCLETPEQAVPGDEDEPHVFSFYSDLEASPEVGEGEGHWLACVVSWCLVFELVCALEVRVVWSNCLVRRGEQASCVCAVSAPAGRWQAEWGAV